MLFAFWRQPAVQKINGGRTYVVDHLSAEGARAVADYWEPVLSAHSYEAMESVFCDSLEYDVATDWTPNLPEVFREERGYDLLPYLPFIGMTNTFPAGDVPAFPSSPADVRIRVNNDYMEVLTRLYCRNHLQVLEEMAEAHGKTVRYQVAYNKPFEEERCGLYVGIPENEALGRCQLDGQRLMAAAAHLGRKKRYSFECAAEFGQCYGQGYEDLMWWIKRSQMAGMNAQVFHGASYSGACIGADPQNPLARNAVWPGYEGFGKFVSNNWNRTPDVGHARGCLDAITRQNSVFRKQARVDLAIFRQAYENNGNGADFYLYDDGGALQNLGYSYEFVSDELLRLTGAEVKDGELDRDGVGYRALIVPPQERMSENAMKTILELSRQGLTVVLAGKAPEEALYYSESRTREKYDGWRRTRDLLWHADGGKDGEGACLYRAEDLSGVPEVLRRHGILPRVLLDGKSDVMTAVRRDEENSRVWYALYGYHRVGIGENPLGPGDADPKDVKPIYHRPGRSSAREVKAALEGKGSVFSFDPWSGKRYPLAFSYDGEGWMRGTLILEEDELVLLCLETGKMAGDTGKSSFTPPDAGEKEQSRRAGEICLQQFSFYPFGPDTPEETSFLRSSFAQEPSWTAKLEGEGDLVPWRKMDPSLEFAVGAGIYRGVFTVEAMPQKGERLMLCLGDVYDTFTVCVNGEQTLFPDQVMKRVDITDLAREGENTLEVRVVSELHNLLVGQAKDGGVPGIPAPQYLPRDYGIMPSDMKPLELLIIN